MAITLQQAKDLRPGHWLHTESAFARPCDSRNGPIKWRVNGMPRTWKRDESRVEVPLKHGLYTYDTLRADDLHKVHLESECPVFNPVNTTLVEALGLQGSNVL